MRRRLSSNGTNHERIRIGKLSVEGKTSISGKNPGEANVAVSHETPAISQMIRDLISLREHRRGCRQILLRRTRDKYVESEGKIRPTGGRAGSSQEE